MQKEQKELFEKNNGEEKNTKASKIKKENNNTKSKYFIPVTRNNLYSILASGLVVPSSNYYDYEDDLQRMQKIWLRYGENMYKKDILKRLQKRENFSFKLLKKFKKIQLSLDYKKKKSAFIIKNNFTNKSIKKDIKHILKNI